MVGKFIKFIYGCWYLKIIKWLNRVNDAHEFRKHETVLF